MSTQQSTQGPLAGSSRSGLVLSGAREWQGQPVPASIRRHPHGTDRREARAIIAEHLADDIDAPEWPSVRGWHGVHRLPRTDEAVEAYFAALEPDPYEDCRCDMCVPLPIDFDDPPDVTVITFDPFGDTFCPEEIAWGFTVTQAGPPRRNDAAARWLAANDEEALMMK